MLAVAAHCSKLDIERLLAARFPKPDLRPHLAPIAEQFPLAGERLAPAQVDVVAAPPPTVTRATALAPQRFGLALTVGQATHDKLTRAQALLRYRVPTGDLAEVVDRALDALLAVREKERLAATEQPQKRAVAASAQPGYRHIPRLYDGPSSRATASDAPSSALMAGAATSAASSSWITSSQLPAAVRAR